MMTKDEMMGIIATEALEAGSPAPTGSAYGCMCPVCGEQIYDSQLILDTEDGMAHEECCNRGGPVSSNARPASLQLETWGPYKRSDDGWYKLESPNAELKERLADIRSKLPPVPEKKK